MANKGQGIKNDEYNRLRQTISSIYDVRCAELGKLNKMEKRTEALEARRKWLLEQVRENGRTSHSDSGDNFHGSLRSAYHLFSRPRPSHNSTKGNR